MSNYLLTINLVAAGLILARAVCALNDMTAGAEHHLDRFFCSVLATGAVAVLLGPLYGYTVPPLGEVAMNAGFAGLYAVPWLYETARQRLWRKSNGQP
ncbi:hypothetical protein ACIPEN_05810 [Herbaspirillum chlorophenolicum]|uniref:Holin n=1 Tax=Herbaspirillum chlorophenolicum TaxID=211589 RepID=A0ABW8EV44_9BURK